MAKSKKYNEYHIDKNGKKIKELIMMHNKQPYSFEKTDVRGRFLLNFSCTKVQSNDVSPIAGNGCGLKKFCFYQISKNRKTQKQNFF